MLIAVAIVIAIALVGAIAGIRSYSKRREREHRALMRWCVDTHTAPYQPMV